MSDLRRRLDRLDKAKGPLGAVIRWLEYALTFPSLPAYIEWLLDQPDDAWPLVRIPAQAAAAAALAYAGEGTAAAGDARRHAERDAVFLVMLCLEVNVVIATTTAFEQLRHRALLAEAYGLVLDELAELRPAQADRRLDERWQAWVSDIASHLVELYAFDEVRRQLEIAFLGGHAILFPDAAAAAERLLASSEAVARLAADTGATPGDQALDSRAPASLDFGALRAHGRARAEKERAQIVDAVRHKGHSLYREWGASREDAKRLMRPRGDGATGEGAGPNEDT